MGFPNEFCEVPDILCKFVLCPTILGTGVWVRPEAGGSADGKPAEL